MAPAGMIPRSSRRETCLVQQVLLVVVAVLLFSLSSGPAAALEVNLRTRESGWDGETWKGSSNVTSTTMEWHANETAIIVVDMWDKHWCPPVEERELELALRMEPVLQAARNLGMQIIFAPSKAWEPYKDLPARKWVEQLDNTGDDGPVLELNDEPSQSGRLKSGTTGGFYPVPKLEGEEQHPPDSIVPILSWHGCPVNATVYEAWTRQTDRISIYDQDAILACDTGATPAELLRIMRAKSIKQVVYMGVALNMCVMHRHFGIRNMKKLLGWSNTQMVFARDLTDVVFNPRDPPHWTVDEALEKQIEFLEGNWAASMSGIEDILIGRPQSKGGGVLHHEESRKAGTSVQ